MITAIRNDENTRISFTRNGKEIAYAVREKISPYFWLLKIPLRDGYIDRDQYSNDLIERVKYGKYKELQ